MKVIKNIDKKPEKKDLVDTWNSVLHYPLYTLDKNGFWQCTEDGEGDFLAAVETNEGWWIRHCVIEDEIGLCIVYDDYNEPAPWSLNDVSYWSKLPVLNI